MDQSYGTGGGQMMAQTQGTMGGTMMTGGMTDNSQMNITGGTGMLVNNHSGNQPNYALATTQRIPGLDDGTRREKRRQRRAQEAERNTSAEEKEFASLTTKKNLCNVQNKLERAMNDLNISCRPTMEQEDMLTPEYLRSAGIFGASMKKPMMLPGDINRAISKDSKGSMMSRRSSFGSEAAMTQAKHMTDMMQGERQNVTQSMMLKLSADIIDQRQKAAIRNPIERGNLRDLLRIDDRVDPEKVNAQKYRPAKNSGGLGVDVLQEKKILREKAQAIAEQHQEEDEDRTPSPIERLKASTPRMRHMISYRCQNEKETRNH